jgi:anti-anti-sigma regulatory factor
MLRITSTSDGQDRVLQLEGKICRQWVDELSMQIHSALGEHSQIILDFSKVSFIDEDAAQMLSRFSPGQLNMKNCSLYVRTIIDLHKR